jgi:hypothetical protein
VKVKPFVKAFSLRFPEVLTIFETLPLIAFFRARSLAQGCCTDRRSGQGASVSVLRTLDNYGFRPCSRISQGPVLGRIKEGMLLIQQFYLPLHQLFASTYHQKSNHPGS